MKLDFKEFLKACCAGNLGTVQQGLPFFNLKQADQQGLTPLMFAIYSRQVGVVQALLIGSDLGQQDDDGDTAVMVAARGQGPLEITQLLIAAGSDLRQANKKGQTPLIIAAGGGHLLAVQALIPGSDPQQTDKAGRTALQWAHQEGHTEIVTFLIEREKALLRSVDNEDPAPLHRARVRL